MVDNSSSGDNKRLRESVVKEVLPALDWDTLKEHCEDIVLSRRDLTDICGHVRRCTGLICKRPNQNFQQRRTRFFNELRSYTEARFGLGAVKEIDTEVALIERIEQGYWSILNTLDKCAISQQPATVRAAGCISHACHVCQDLMRHFNKALAGTKEITPEFGHLQDDGGRSFSGDAVFEGLSESVATTLLMEAHKNKWFENHLVVLPELAKVDDEIRSQSGAMQYLALCWRQWQHVEERRRFLGGDLRVCADADKPASISDAIEALTEYVPPEDGYSEREVYDYLANSRLKDGLIQNFLSMETEIGLSGRGVGISNGAALPPKQLVSGKEAHAGVALCEILGYSIGDDDERPGGLRLLEWVRGYAVLEEITRSRIAKKDASGDDYAILLEKGELVGILQACGLEGDLAFRFIERTCLRQSSHDMRASYDMRDHPLVRVGTSSYLLFPLIAPNIALIVLSNLSKSGVELSHKGQAFERSVHKAFHERGMDAFAFKARRDGQEFEYDAVVPWEDRLFVFECKNRSLSGHDPASIYYFDLDVASHAKQVRRLADALVEHPDIIEQKMGAQYVGMTVVPCVLHSLPYSRIGDLDGVYFTDFSALRRFFDKPDFGPQTVHRVGGAMLLHRTAIMRLWKGEKPTVEDFLKQLEEPFQLVLLLKHLGTNHLCFHLSESEGVLATELVRTDMTTESICEAVGVDAESGGT